VLNKIDLGAHVLEKRIDSQQDAKSE
jgi:hypothetical protein